MDRTHRQEQHPFTDFAWFSTMAGDSSQSSRSCWTEHPSTKQTICLAPEIIVALAKYPKETEWMSSLSPTSFDHSLSAISRLFHPRSNTICSKFASLFQLSQSEPFEKRLPIVQPLLQTQLRCSAPHVLPHLWFRKETPQREKDLSEQTTTFSCIHASFRKLPQRHKCHSSNSSNKFSQQLSPTSVPPLTVFDTYALIDPGSTGTYVLDSISHSLDLETGHQFVLDVQFLNLSRSSFSVRPTAFKIAPYTDNEKQFEIKNAYTTTCLNTPTANISDLNGICQSNSMLRHIKFPDIDKGRIGILRGTSCVHTL